MTDVRYGRGRQFRRDPRIPSPELPLPPGFPGIFSTEPPGPPLPDPSAAARRLRARLEDPSVVFPDEPASRRYSTLSDEDRELLRWIDVTDPANKPPEGVPVTPPAAELGDLPGYPGMPEEDRALLRYISDSDPLADMPAPAGAITDEERAHALRALPEGEERSYSPTSATAEPLPFVVTPPAREAPAEAPAAEPPPLAFTVTPRASKGGGGDAKGGGDETPAAVSEDPLMSTVEAPMSRAPADEDAALIDAVSRLPPGEPVDDMLMSNPTPAGDAMSVAGPVDEGIRRDAEAMLARPRRSGGEARRIFMSGSREGEPMETPLALSEPGRATGGPRSMADSLRIADPRFDPLSTASRAGPRLDVDALSMISRRRRRPPAAGGEAMSREAPLDGPMSAVDGPMSRVPVGGPAMSSVDGPMSTLEAPMSRAPAPPSNPFAGVLTWPGLSATTPGWASAEAPPRRRGGAGGGAGGSGGGAGRATGGPEMTDEERLNQALLDALTPEGVRRAFPEDRRGETGLERDRRLASGATALELRGHEIEAMAAADERDRVGGELAARRELEEQRQSAMADARRRYQNAIDRASAITIDPDGFYHSRGVGGVIASSIAIGLGAIGAGVNGGTNVALDMINSEIDRDLQAQAANLDNAWRSADAQGGLVEMMAQEFSSREAALEAARSLALEDAAARVQEQLAQLGSAEASHNGEVMLAQLNDDAAAAAAAAFEHQQDHTLEMENMRSRIHARDVETARAERRLMGGGGGAASGGGITRVTAQQMDAFNRAVDSGSSPDEAAAIAGISVAAIPPDGRFAEASSAESVASMAALDNAVSSLVASIGGGRGEDIPGVGVWDGFWPSWAPETFFGVGDRGRDIRNQIENIISLVSQARSGAAVTDVERERIERTIRGAGTEAELRTNLNRLLEEIGVRRSRRTGRGATPGSSVESDLAEHGGREVR